MTCRHKPGDPTCSSSGYLRASGPVTPDSRNYKILDFSQVGPHLVLKVRYPNCAACSFEGVKILVYLNLDIHTALSWEEIDPHFADPNKPLNKTRAPSPNARFPASNEGWMTAVFFCETYSKFEDS